MSRRELDVVVLSDIHLGTADCQANELLNYLHGIKPKTLILNGDIIQMTHRKAIFSEAQMKIFDEILWFSSQGSIIYMITGNRDDRLRRFSPFNTSHFKLRDNLLLQLRGKQYWIFHGDVFDLSGFMTPWLIRRGREGYLYLLRLNRWVNKVRKLFGWPAMSLSAKLRKWPLKAKQYIEQFERTAMKLAMEKGYDAVICGHTHHPVIRREQDITYMNCGDWVENLTALEYKFDKWRLYRYDHLDYDFVNPKLSVPINRSVKQTTKVAMNSEQLIETFLNKVKS